MGLLHSSVLRVRIPRECPHLIGIRRDRCGASVGGNPAVLQLKDPVRDDGIQWRCGNQLRETVREPVAGAGAESVPGD